MKAGLFTTEDWLLINDFIVQAGTFTSLKEYNNQILKLLKSIINYDCCNFFLHNEVDPDMNRPITVDIENSIIDDYIKYYQFIDTIKEKTFNTPAPIRSTDILDYKEWVKTEYFNDFFKANQFYYSCGIDIYYKETLLATVGFFRNKNCPDFNLKELIYLELVAPHIGNQLYKLIIMEEKLKIDKRNYKKIVENSGEKYNLTSREFEVAELVIRGLNNKEISDSLFISVNTVKKHLYSLFLKTKAENRTQFVGKILNIEFEGELEDEKEA